MAPRESEPQKETVERVMHEFKHGELAFRHERTKGQSRRQAVAIALSEAGASNQPTPKENQEHLRRTKAKERRGKDGAGGSRRQSAAPVIREFVAQFPQAVDRLISIQGIRASRLSAQIRGAPR